MTSQSVSWAVANHLWQSTAMAFGVWMLTLILRKNSARVRHVLWLVASAKFLVPLSALIALGSYLRPADLHTRTQSPVPTVVVRMTVPFTTYVSLASNEQGAWAHEGTGSAWPALSHRVGLAFLFLWAFGSLAVLISWRRKWNKLSAIIKNAEPVGFANNVQLLSSHALIEPGVFGVFQPFILVPESIRQRLSGNQLQAVLEHELCHVRRRDNLAAAFHMCVEAVFWFYPLVWWIGKRLIEERELACDEAVLQAGNEPEEYAQGILNVCKAYLESPLACVSGVSGADLKGRVVRIVTRRVTYKLDLSRKVLLGAAGMVAVAAPVSLGLLHAFEANAQTPPAYGPQNAGPGPAMSKGPAGDFPWGKPEPAPRLPPMAADANPEFEVATIKPSKPNSAGKGFMLRGRHFSTLNTSLMDLLMFSYRVDARQVVGLPGWASSQEFDIEAQPAGEGEPSDVQWRTMVQKLLATRFHMSFHREQRQLSVYVLTVAKGGPKLATSKDAANNMMNLRGSGDVVAVNADLGHLTELLQGAVLDKPVIDRTGLSGRYDFELKWTPDPTQLALIRFKAPPAAAYSPDAPPDLFAAMQQQLGLKLESTKASVNVMVIDHVEQPSAN